MNPTDLPLEKLAAIMTGVILLVGMILYFQGKQLKYFMETLKHLFKRNSKD